MLFSENLEEIIFHRHKLFKADELVIISGYLGPNPVAKLGSLPLKSTVIYGMYGDDGVRTKLHDSLVELNKTLSNTDILYSTIPVHSKCYIWKNKGEIVHALIGSANFSINGLTRPFKEILGETTYDTFAPISDYLDKILEKAINCDEHTITEPKTAILNKSVENLDKEVCTMVLYDPNKNEVQNANGLNWGQSSIAHTNSNDSNIPVRAFHIRNYPNLFPAKQEFPIMSSGGKENRHNDAIEIIWDDGTTMVGLLEGNQKIDGIIYPKQIASFPQKKILGEYIRERLNVPSGQKVNKNDLNNYGRSDIDVSLQEEGIYYFDFSVVK